MNTYFLTNRFGELTVYNLKKLTIDVLNKLGPIQQIGELRVIVDKNVNEIGHIKTSLKEIKDMIDTLDPETITVITKEEIDELLNT